MTDATNTPDGHEHTEACYPDRLERGLGWPNEPMCGHDALTQPASEGVLLEEALDDLREGLRSERQARLLQEETLERIVSQRDALKVRGVLLEEAVAVLRTVRWAVFRSVDFEAYMPTTASTIDHILDRYEKEGASRE